MNALLATVRVQARYWRRHRLQALLCLLGIVLGVAVFTAIQMANRGAMQAFAQGVQAFAGAATHRVQAPSGAGLPEALYARLAALPGVRAATPVLSERLWSQGPQPVALTVLGIDPLSDADFRDFAYVPEDAAGDAAGAARRMERFLAEPDAVVLPAALARRLGVAAGDVLTLDGANGPQRFHVLALFHPPAAQAAAFSRTLVQDVAAHQERFGKLGRLDAILLVLDAGAEPAVRALLPPDAQLEPVGRRIERVERMSRAFRLNLEALGGFALLVAMFLIFNAASFSVAQRDRTLALLRCIGASTRTVFVALLAEAACVGALGAVLGVLLGRWLGALMLRNTGATLFEVVLHVAPLPASVALDAGMWAVGLALGIGVSLLGALQPALHGARTAPLAAVQRARRRTPRFPLRLWAGGAAVALLLSALLLRLPGSSLVPALGAATLLALGMAALCPLAAALLSRVSAPLLGQLLGAAGRMAARNLGRSLGRTGVAAASLMVALSLALAIQITVRSFRHTFELWLEQAVTADLYLDPAVEPGPPLDADVLAALRGLPGVADVALLRSRRVVLGDREVLVLSIDMPAFSSHARIPAVDVPQAQAWARLSAGEAFVSEALAYPLGLAAGDRITLPTPRGAVALTIGAVVQNYTSPQGLVYVSLAQFGALFGHEAPRRAALWLAPGAPLEATLAALERLPVARNVLILRNAELRRDALRLFDRTFVITDLMGSLAAFVAFVAVVSALTALLEERMRTLGYLRAIGVSRRALGLSLGLEAALLALAATLVSWVTGLAMAWVLVFFVNRRAFGWTLQFLPGSGSYLGLFALALLAALLGSLWPVWRATRLSIVATIREE